MKTRELRRKILIGARMRVGSAWRDVCVVNVSLHGIGVQSGDAPPRGTYVEIRRGRHVLIARVAWSDGQRFGARTQDQVDVDALASDVAQPKSRMTDRPSGTLIRDRTTAHVDQAMVGRLAQFAFVVGLGLAGTLTLFQMVSMTLVRTLADVGQVLGPP